MPIYEYQCSACNHQFDVLQKMSDEPINICPECNKPAATRLVSAAGFQLKGTGWYATDFKHGQPKKENKSDSKSTETTKKTKGKAE